MVPLKSSSTKKRLLFKIWKFPRLSETFITAQIITAIKCGFEVSVLVKEVLSFEESKQLGLLKQYAIGEKIILEDFNIPKNRIWRFFRIFTFFPSILADFGGFWSFLKVQDKLSLSHFYRFHFYSGLKGFDIVHVQYGTNAKPFDLLKKIGLCRAKLIVSFHGHDVFFPINGWIENKGYYTDLIEQGDLMVANTPYLENEMQKLGFPPEKMRTIPVGVDTQFFQGKKQEKDDRKPFQIITVGRLDKVKGQRYAIQVIKNLKENGFKVHLNIVGEGAERKNLEELIHDLQVEAEVTLLGKKSPKEIRSCLLSSDLYILAAVPVHNDRRETQGLATLEAQSCGLPVVVFDSGGVKYTVKNGKTGFVVPEHDVDKMTEKCAYLIKNRSILHEMGVNVRHFVVSNYSNAIIEDQWQKIYAQYV